MSAVPAERQHQSTIGLRARSVHAHTSSISKTAFSDEASVTHKGATQ
jgi:hypothetical protein